jgi:stearoyl-CoA desaturase (Delta-9 desaturase)
VAELEHDPDAIQWVNVAFLTVFPAVALAGTVWYATTHGIGWQEPLAALAMWILTGLGITAGYHRLFSHRTYKAHPAVRFLYAAFGGAAVQNSVIAWCSDHRRHHSCVDTDKDPYNAQRGLFYSHMGWIMRDGHWGHEAYTNVPDLSRDPILKHQHDHYILWAFAVNLLMFLAAGWLTGLWVGMFVIAVLLRIVVVQHFTFLINSVAHVWGSQPFSARNSSRDNWLLSLLTMGEGYHNYHHAFEADYRNGIAWYAYDPSKWLIFGLSRIRLAHDLRRTPEDVVLRRRFEEGRRTLSERLEAWGEAKAEAWAMSMSRGREEFVARFEALMDQLNSHELDVEPAEELRRRLQERAARAACAAGRSG